ncbi:signal peptidase I [Butyrivibrio sp. AC2005]|uniref:signal peptidase I n=1 Tax=Butyrivibrio sp. AC2005 TaxID=1280672 RepID=UPI0004243DA6|nr:signal peptidase I [Butyrivibrio sp. AC2005]
MKRLIKMLFLTVMVLFLYGSHFGIILHAEGGKTIMVPVNKNYTSAKFTLTFEYYDDYVVVIKSPSGKEYKGVVSSDSANEAECVVNDVEIGQWEVHIDYPEIITAGDTPDGSDEGADSGEGENLGEGNEGISEEPVQRREISPVKVQLQGSTETLVDVNEDLKVVTDIAGLKKYFKDDSFVAEWTDTTCGTVNVEVVNAKNLQKIDTARIQGNYYSCPLDPSVQEIMVTIVPAVSSSVEGTGSTFSLKFDNNPDATVTYEDLTITNHDTINVSCELRDKYSVEVLVNGKVEESTETLDPGIYEFQAPIEVGTNEIVTYIVDEDGNMRSTKHTVDKDVVGPSLELVSSYEDIVTEDQNITIEGAVSDYNTLMINSTEVEVEGDNTFKYEYKLKEGVNQIAVIASDEAGNDTEYDIAVERVIPEEKPVPWLKIIICAALFGILVIYVFEVIRRRNNPETYEKKKKLEVEEHTEYDDVDISGLTKKEKKDIMKGPHVVWDILSFAVPLLAAYIILTYVIMVSVIQSGSMEPTLDVGNTVFYNRLAFVNHEPSRGDVIVFYSDEYASYFGKRIIGLPGDKIRFQDGYVVVNDQFCDETAYIPSEAETNCSKEFEVPEGCYFLLGDNRENSNDSRYWQQPYISRDKIMGKYMGQIDFSFQRDVLKAF